MEGGGPTKRHSTMKPVPRVLYLELVKKIAVAKNKSFGKRPPGGGRREGP